MMEKVGYPGYVERQITLTLPLSTMKQIVSLLQEDESLLLPEPMADVLKQLLDVYFSQPDEPYIKDTEYDFLEEGWDK
jgi:hypothetical protein